MIPDSAVKAIQDSVATTEIEVDGGKFATRQVYLPPQEPMPGTLAIHTLAGLIEYINKVADKSTIEAIHVISHNEVRVIGALTGRHRQRPIYAQATPAGSSRFHFDHFLSAEEFIIGVQVSFVKTPQRDQLLSIIGTLKDESVKTANDDGVTQSVTTRKGVSLGQETAVPNPIALKPYRTFAEINQPESAYVLRLKRRDGDLPSIALFETAEAAWELEAIRTIREFLSEAITDVSIIA